MRFISTLLLPLLISFNAVAQPTLPDEELLVETSKGSEIPVSVFKTDNNSSDILLWLPSEYGLHGRESITAKAIAKLGLKVWIADLHSAYFVPFGRKSYDNIPVSDIAELIQKASNQNQHVILFGTGRAARLALLAVHQVQKNPAAGKKIRGAIFFHPNLFADTPGAGQSADYHAIAYSSNLPIYIAQPSNSGKSYQLDKLSEILQTGGSDVFTQILNGVSDGFNIREPENKLDAEMTARVPYLITHATKMLKLYDNKERIPVAIKSDTTKKQTSTLKIGLQAYQGDIKNPSFSFKDLENKTHSLADYKNQVVLINFWATWCPPCVKELPSMNRLKSKVGNERFSILAIDVGDDKKTIEKFLEKTPVIYPVLIDSNGKSVKPWNLLAFPTSFVIDKKGKIRYGLFGGLEWDNDDVIAIITQLLAE